MTITETNNFYEQDEKKYEIASNKDFLDWLENAVKNGYHCYIKTFELQELIDRITNWYEIKYPEREFNYYDRAIYKNFLDMNFSDIKSISNVMDIRQLLFRLPRNQLCLMESGYRARGWEQHPIYENGKKVGWKAQIYMRIYIKTAEEHNLLWRKKSFFLLNADHMTGEVSKDYELEDYLNSEKDLSLDKLLSIFNEKYTSELDFGELKECVYDHNCDMELRDRILQLVALKLLYSRNTIPERGYERAKRFINEFNKKLGLNLSTEEIDEIMSADYSNFVSKEKRKQKLVRKGK